MSLLVAGFLLSFHQHVCNSTSINDTASTERGKGFFYGCLWGLGKYSENASFYSELSFGGFPLSQAWPACVGVRDNRRPHPALEHLATWNLITVIKEAQLASIKTDKCTRFPWY